MTKIEKEMRNQAFNYATGYLRNGNWKEQQRWAKIGESIGKPKGREVTNDHRKTR